MRRFTISNVIGFDDFPFPRPHRGDVQVVGAVFSALRLDGILSGRVRRDGRNATRVLAELIAASKFSQQLQLVMLQGIALGGFNVVDIHGLNKSLDIPVLIVARRAPRMEIIRKALLEVVPGGKRKWMLIERAGPMESVGGVFVQRAGLSLELADQVIHRFSVHGSIPEPLRVAHLIVGGVATGKSKGRA
jgi:endonuclease V-like protein UPF0215 family